MTALAARGRRPGADRPWQNRVLIGAAAVLIALVGVVFAYGANTSLPFVTRYVLHLDFTNGQELVRGAEVHDGGSLIGFVRDVRAVHGPDGRPLAQATVSLDAGAARLSRAARFTIRLKGTIGTKYVDVTAGSAPGPTWPNGATVPADRTGASVDLDQFLDVFTPRVRRGVRETTLGYGEALAGRGADLNDAIGALGPFSAALGPAMAGLAIPATRLGDAIAGLTGLAGTVAPVADRQADLVRGLDRTFGALAAVAPSFRATILRSPATLDTVVERAPGIERLTASTARLFTALAPGLATLPASAPQFAAAVRTGVRTLPATRRLDPQLVRLAAVLARYTADPTVTAGLDRLTLTATSLRRPLAHLTPAQTGCAVFSNLLANLSSSLSDRVGSGNVLRFVIVAIDDVTGGEAVPSHGPYLSTSLTGGTHHAPLHTDPSPDTDAPGGPARCSAGHEHYDPSHAQIGTGL